MYRWRLLGVLQYFGVSYIWVGVVVLVAGSWDGAVARAVAEMEEALDAEGNAPPVFADLTSVMRWKQ